MALCGFQLGGFNLGAGSGLPNRARLLPETVAYIAAVDTAGGEVLAPRAINTYFRGLKANGIWDKIKASALFAGVDFAGCFVPLRSDMPTPENVNFDDDQHNVLTGLKGDGSSMYLNTEYDNAANGQNDKHASVYINELPDNFESSDQVYLGRGETVNGTTRLGIIEGEMATRHHSNLIARFGTSGATGFFGVTRLNSATYTARHANQNLTISRQSQPPLAGNLFVFRRNAIDTAPSTVRLLTYTVGSGLFDGEQVLLDTLQTKLRDDIAAELA
jgi:hypothetical protein